MNGKDPLQDGEGAKKGIQNIPPSASIKQLKKTQKKNEFFQVIKQVFTQQMFSVIWQIQLTHCAVMLITAIDLIINCASEKKDMWYNYAMVLAQFFLSIIVLVAVNKKPLKYNIINTISCVIIHSIWAILQATSEYYENRGGMSYMIGILSFLMIQNSSNSRAKFFLVALNSILFCVLSRNSSAKDIHYVVIITIVALYAISSEEDGREQLMKTVQQMLELKNVLPQSLLVAGYDKTADQIDLQTFNNKAQSIFNLNGTKQNFLDFCEKVTIHRIEKSRSSHQIGGGRSTGLRSMGARSGRSGREFNETLFYLEEESQNRPSGVVNNNEIKQGPPPLPPMDDDISRQGINLYTFLMNRFKRFDEEMQRGIGKSSSIQSQDKKSTKTQLAAGTTAGVASKSFFAQSKTLINMLTTQKSNKKMMMPHQSLANSKGKQLTKKNYDYKCIFKRKVPQPGQANEEGSETVDELQFTLKIGMYSCIDECFIVMSLEESGTGIDEKHYNFSRRARFYEQFCQQSLLKTNEAVLNLVNELKQLMSKSSVITEADLNRFIGSNLNIGTQGGGGDSALSNNLKSQGSNIGTINVGTGLGGGGGSVISNPLGGNTNKGIYCVPKRFLENIHQQGILTNNIIGNFANYFAMKDNKRQDIDMKPFSIMKVIKNVQRLFQRTIDRKGIRVLINQSQEPIAVHQSSPVSQQNHPQIIPLSQNTSVSNLNPNSSARDFSMIPLIMSANNFQPSATNKNSTNEVQPELFSSSAYQLRITAGLDAQQNQQQVQKKQSQSTPAAPATSAAQKVCDEITNDESKFQHLIFNLLSNAVQYTPVYGLIAIQIQRDHKFEDCIKIRIRNTCPTDFLFPFVNTKDITLNWEDMLEEFEANESFFFGTKMAAQLSFILGPYNSLQFQNLETNELQVDFLVFDFSSSNPHHYPHEPVSFCKSDPSCDEKSPKESHTQPARMNNNSEKYDISSHQNQIRIDSCDSFDKWIKIQSLEQQKAKSTLKIRNQLQFKN